MKMNNENPMAGSRVELLCDGKLILGVSVRKRPENQDEMKAPLRELIETMGASDMPDPEVLG